MAKKTKCKTESILYQINKDFMSGPHQKGRKDNSTVEKPGTHLARWTRLTSSVISNVTECKPYMMSWEGEKDTSFLWSSSQKPMKKKTTIHKPQLRNIPQNIWPMLFKTSKVMKNKESLISHTLRRNITTRNRDSGWNPGMNEGHWRKLVKSK